MELRTNQEAPVQIGIEFFKMPKIAPSIIVAPTAFGKSIVIAFIAKGVNDKILVIQPTKELLEQNYGKFIELGGTASVYSASMNSREIGDVTYATIGSILKIAQKFKELGFTKVIVDEADRYPRNASGMFRRFLIGAGITHTLGLTATPLKLQTNMGEDGNSISKLVMLTNRSKTGIFFNHILYVAQISEMVKEKYWTPLQYQSYDFDTGELIYNSTRAEYTEKSMIKAYINQDIDGKIIKKVKELTDRRHILIAVPTVEQATDLARRIPNAAIVHGGTKKKERNKIIADFKSGKIRVVVQVNVLTIGFDFPELDCIITGRPTNSISWWYQFVGRVTRIHKDKPNGLVVDFVGSVSRFGKVEDLYFADNDEKWEMYGKGGKLLTGIPMHEIGLFLEDGTDLGKIINIEDDTEEKIFIKFGKYLGREVRQLPTYYTEWLLKNYNWNNNTLKIRDEILRLKEIKKR